MFKVWFVLCCLLLVAAPVFAQDAEASTELEPWTCPEGFEGQTLSVYNWSTYIAEDTISNFEELCGVTVVYDVFESNEALLSRLRQGNPGYDIIVPTDYMLQIMIEEGIVQPLDRDAIPNFVHLAENLINTPFDPENEYSVPYQWGTVGIGYNQTATGREINSYAELFAYEGNVAWLEDTRVMLNLGLITQGLEPNAESVEEVELARDHLIANGRNVVAIAADDGQVLLERGDADIVIEYSGDIFQIIDSCECDDFVYVIAEEGGNLWVDNMAIAAGAPNPALANVFIDYILDPQVSADIANYTAFGSPNQTSIDLGLIDEDLLSNPGIYPTDEIRERLYFSEILPVDVEQAYTDAWDEVKILLGR
jgi:spermidine/putrescine transport system substrate-binding protein